MGRHGESPVPCMLQSADGPTKEFMEGTGRENELLNTLKKMIPTVGFEICVEFTFNSPNVPGLTIQAALSLTLNFDYGNSCLSWKGRLGVNVGYGFELFNFPFQINVGLIGTLDLMEVPWGMTQAEDAPPDMVCHSGQPISAIKSFLRDIGKRLKNSKDIPKGP